MSDWSMNETAIRNGHKPYDPESGWQPGRLVIAHPHDDDWVGKTGANIPKAELEPILRTVVRGRRVSDLRECALAIAQCDSCDAQVFYEIHPEDLMALGADGCGAYACEHEFLTD